MTVENALVSRRPPLRTSEFESVHRAVAQVTGEVVLVSVFSLLLLAGTVGYWTYLDAVDREDERAPVWALAVFAGTLVGVVPGVVVLLVYRSRAGADV
ncbi:hypothetical protein [Natronorarus salvus]|uniref:hypothetical protein n=1 Tax=Natronorarus salvus TaxID=3117733 RepID=UPI002F26AD78